MKITEISLENVKLFRSRVDIPLLSTGVLGSVTTLSGANGSGKSAVVEALAAVQRAGLIESLKVETGRDLTDLHTAFLRDLRSLASGPKGAIALALSDSSEVRGFLAMEFSVSDGEAEYVLKYDSVGARLLESWHGPDARNLIVAIPPTKYFDEADIYYSSVREKAPPAITGDRSRDSLIRPLLVGPEEALKEVYRNSIEDWFLDRMIPNQGHAFSNAVARLFFSYILPHVKVSHFSTVVRPGEIVCNVKRDGATSYDLRQLSSGEKYIYLTFVLLARYAGKMLMVVFDEPENHLHEETLARLHSVLSELVGSDSPFEELVAEIRSETRLSFPSRLERHLPSEDPFTRQALLVTHSKLLIRRNLTVGSNSLLSPGNQPVRLGGSETEELLRRAGVSQVDERVVFVEGSTDQDLLQRAFGGAHVEVRPLTGKDAVCAAFEGFARIDASQRHPGFAFLLDRDSGNDVRYERLRDRFEGAWDRHVVVLERVELENYLLEENLFLEAAKNSLDSEEAAEAAEVLTEEAMIQILREAADETRAMRMRHFAATELDRRRQQLLPLPAARELDFETDGEFRRVATAIVPSDFQQAWIGVVQEVEALTKERFGEQEWAGGWRALCKGKKAFPKACLLLAERLRNPLGSLIANTLKQRVIRYAVESQEIPLREVVVALRRALYLS